MTNIFRVDLNKQSILYQINLNDQDAQRLKIKDKNIYNASKIQKESALAKVISGSVGSKLKTITK